MRNFPASSIRFGYSNIFAYFKTKRFPENIYNELCISGWTPATVGVRKQNPIFYIEGSPDVINSGYFPADDETVVAQYQPDLNLTFLAIVLDK